MIVIVIVIPIVLQKKEKERERRRLGKMDSNVTYSLSQMNLDPPAFGRRKSTLIFDDEEEMGYTNHEEHSKSMDSDSSSSTDSLRTGMCPVEITWQQGGDKVYVTGSFTGWRKMIGLVPVPDQQGLLHVKLQLPIGTHRFRFIVDNELRFSDYLPTATDQMGNFVNYLEIGRGQRESLSARSRIAMEIENEPDDIGNGFTRFREELPLRPSVEYTQDIPAVFTDPSVMEQYYLTLDQQQHNHQNMAWLTPPALPPHLEDVPLNSYSGMQGDNNNENNSGALPIPNHVVLNHLATSSIKHNTLCVASIVRYKRKYVTQILYAPLQ